MAVALVLDQNAILGPAEVGVEDTERRYDIGSDLRRRQACSDYLQAQMRLGAGTDTGARQQERFGESRGPRTAGASRQHPLDLHHRGSLVREARRIDESNEVGKREIRGSCEKHGPDRAGAKRHEFSCRQRAQNLFDDRRLEIPLMPDYSERSGWMHAARNDDVQRAIGRGPRQREAPQRSRGDA